jgi:hypothetical protein
MNSWRVPIRVGEKKVEAPSILEPRPTDPEANEIVKIRSQMHTSLTLYFTAVQSIAR